VILACVGSIRIVPSFEKLAITGFSGGGNLCYWWTLQHPESLALAVGGCANFGGVGLQGAKSVTGGGPTVLLLTGEKDEINLEVFGQKPGIVGQTDSIEESLKKLGFTNVTRRVVPGAGIRTSPPTCGRSSGSSSRSPWTPRSIAGKGTRFVDKYAPRDPGPTVARALRFRLR